ncbi:MAG TPA: trehalose-6-phosphate synthase [Gemmatimonadaceae bacterium]
MPRPLDRRSLIILSNREPYEHIGDASGVAVRTPAGGLVSALDPTMRRTAGVWVAWGSGSADREHTGADGRLPVPPAEPAYTLRRVFLEPREVEGYYQGFANSALWPLCHLLIQHFEFRAEHWERYKAVNERFARAVADEVRRSRDEPLVWVQDYHFALAPQMLRAMVPGTFIHQFWHIPFPPPDILRLLPSGTVDSLLRGMLGNDLLEFHTERYARNFLDCVSQFCPDIAVDERRLCAQLTDHTLQVGAFPISIDVEMYETLAASPTSTTRVGTWRERYAGSGRQLGVSVDRLDYTKGIPERLRALDLLWTRHPELREKFTMLVVATPSRSDLPAYSRLEEEVVAMALGINERHRTPDWTPIVLVTQSIDAELVSSVFRAADLCLVSSLQDGMNLVAKEFIACQTEERGVLVLSRFTGAAEEIDGALLINPFNVDGFAMAIREALAMPPGERRERMRRMRAQLREATIFDWLEAILSRCARILDARASDARSREARDARDAREPRAPRARTDRTDPEHPSLGASL